MDGGIDPEKAPLANRYSSGYNDVRGNERIIADAGMMADVVATPEKNVIADAHERLDDVVLEDKTVFAATEILPDRRTRAEIGREPITLFFSLSAFLGAQAVEMAIAGGDEEIV